MAKNYFNRYIWLIDLIQRSGHISFEEIDRAWRRSTYNEYGEGLSERTFFNHKKAIYETFDIKIKQNFALPKGFDPKDTFRKLFGVILDNGPVEKVVIRVSDEQVKYYRTLPLHHSQEEVGSGEGYVDFSYSLVPTYDFSRELLSKGDTVEVLSPAWLRREIALELRRAVSMYGDVKGDE